MENERISKIVGFSIKDLRTPKQKLTDLITHWNDLDYSPMRPETFRKMSELDDYIKYFLKQYPEWQYYSDSLRKKYRMPPPMEITTSISFDFSCAHKKPSRFRKFINDLKQRLAEWAWSE